MTAKHRCQRGTTGWHRPANHSLLSSRGFHQIPQCVELPLVRSPPNPPAIGSKTAIMRSRVHRRGGHRRDRTIEVGGVMPVIPHHRRPGANRCPDISLRALLADPVDRLFGAQPSWKQTSKSRKHRRCPASVLTKSRAHPSHGVDQLAIAVPCIFAQRPRAGSVSLTGSCFSPKQGLTSYAPSG